MNKVFISGMICEEPVFCKEVDGIPHLVLSLSVQHRTAAGKRKRELYRVSAWHNAARWGTENLCRGQIIGVQGYLTQRKIWIGNSAITEVEIAADEFLAGNVLPHQRLAGSSIACEAISFEEKK